MFEKIAAAVALLVGLGVGIAAVWPSSTDTSRYYSCPKCGTPRKRGLKRCPACGCRDGGGKTMKFSAILLFVIVIVFVILTLPELLKAVLAAVD